MHCRGNLVSCLGILEDGDIRYLCFYGLPFLAYSISENLPHLLAQIIVSFSKGFHLDAFPVFGVVTLLHEAFVPFPARIGGLIREVLGGNWLPVHALLTSLHEELVIIRRP